MNFQDLKVLVIGDVCLDIIEEGVSKRISPEAPVPVILNSTKKYSLGMAGNTALNLKNLGADVYLCSWKKNDKYGKKIEKLIKKAGIKFANNLSYKVSTNEFNKLTTTVKKRIFANGQQVARLDKENNNIISKELLDILKDYFIDYNTGYFDLVIISDYNKGFICKETWDIFLPQLQRINKGYFFVDTKKKNVTDYFEGMFIFPNTKEMLEIMNYENCKTRDELRQELDLQFLIETKSEKGASIYEKNYISNYPALAKDVVDVCGCGDTFISAFSLYYTKFGNPHKAIRFANYCCSKIVKKKGTTPIKLHEIMDFNILLEEGEII